MHAKTILPLAAIAAFVAAVALSEPFLPASDSAEARYAKEIPTVDLPRELRERNWGGGSCVHASTVHLLRWQGHHELADWWRANYSGGEYAERLNRRMNAAGLKYAFTVDGDTAFLEWALRTRRGAGITYWPSHAVNLVHLDNEWAGLLDNNRIDQIIWIPRAEFLRRWRGYGGWAWSLVYNPPPPKPWTE
jgi:hypothetical protein